MKRSVLIRIKAKIRKKKVAAREVGRLLILAEKNKADEKFARRCIELAVLLAKKYRVTIKREQRRKFCRKCYTFFTSKTCRKRLRKGRIVVTCLRCGWVRRYKYKS